MKPEPIKVSAIFEKAATMKDGSIRLTFDTQEMSAEKTGELFSLRNQFGWLIFASSGTDSVEIPNEPPAEFKGQKSLSERLRNVLYVLWEQQGSQGDFEDFRRVKMDRIISHYKDNLS